MYLYHGSVQSDLQVLRALSPLHGSTEQRGVYLTGSSAYALFYIWDAQHNKTAGKHVTCCLRNGVVYYEEQFDGQLRAFYEGVSGWLCGADNVTDALPVKGREAMWWCPHDVYLQTAEFIPDVYARIRQEMQGGRVVVTQMPCAQCRLLHAHLAEEIVRQGLMRCPEKEEAVFFRTYFPEAWQMALCGEEVD